MREKSRWVVLLGSYVAVAMIGLPQPTARIHAQDTPAAPKSPLRNMLVINEDDSHFFGTRKPEDMTLEGLNAFVDQYANSTITHLFLCPNAQRASFRSTTRDAIWDPVKGVEPQDLWPQNGKRLFEAGLDPYAVWIARCREKKISPWLSMRMNDVHSVEDESHFLHSTFWHEHHEYWRVPHGSAAPWVNRALNYAHAAVREHQMRFVRELLERYDADGLELDWMRFGYHLTPGRETEEGSILTQFVRDVRAATEEWAAKRGRPIYLGVRVPAHPDAAAGLGMDAINWAQEGLVDMIVPCPFWSSSDFDIPVELWRERLGTKWDQVTVAPGLEYNSRPSPGGEAVANDLACARGFAASAHFRGADSLYLFNWMDSETRPVPMSDYERLLREGLSAESVARAERRFPVCYRDTVPGGFPNGAQLPFSAQEGRTIQIPIGPAPSPTDTVWAVVGLSDADSTPTTDWTATLNSKPLGTAEPFAETKELGGPSACAIRFACPVDALVAGYNTLLLQRGASAQPQRVVWAELRVTPAETAVTFPGQTSDWNGYTRTGIIAERYKQLGGDITLIAKPGVGRHPHGLDDPTPIVEFIQKHSTR